MDTKKKLIGSLRFISLTFVIVSGILTIVASGGGGGGGGDDNNGNAPVISNFSPELIRYDYNQGNNPYSFAIDFIDQDGDISTMTISFYDSDNNLLETDTGGIDDMSGEKSGTIEVEATPDGTDPAGTYRIEVYLTDSKNNKSNVLTTPIIVGHSPIISNLSFDFTEGLTATPIIIKFTDGDKDISTMTATSFDSNHNMIDMITISVDELSGTESGTIKKEFNFDPQLTNGYTLEVYVTDSLNFVSNVLSTTISPWTERTPMPEGRRYMGAANVTGKIYILGGQGDQDSITPDTLEYDPEMDTWLTKSPMPFDFYTPFVASAANGKIYVLSLGSVSASMTTLQEYDPITDSWSIKTPMPTVRTAFAMATFNNKLYVVGGVQPGLGTPLNTVEEYDPSSDTWSTKASMPTGRSELAIASANGKIYAIGGSDGSTFLSTVEEYDPVNNNWTTKSSMSKGRVNLAAAVVNDKIYAIGGGIEESSIFVDSNIVEEYDPPTDTWVIKSSMPTTRHALAAIAQEDTIYAIGGSEMFNFLNTVEAYYPLQDQ
jgi:N-acetylneuraminic acid mutarotase